MKPKGKVVSDSLLDSLRSALDAASSDLPLVTQRKMFGCYALFANNNIYALIWKKGRIALRLPKSELFDELMAKTGSEPWTAGDRTMANWVLVPESFHRQRDLLAQWTEAAHGLAVKAQSAKKKR